MSQQARNNPDQYSDHAIDHDTCESDITWLDTIDLGDLCDVVIGGVNTADYPDFVDAFIESANIVEANGNIRALTDEECDDISWHCSDYVQELAMQQLF